MRRRERTRVEQLIKDLGLREWKSRAQEQAEADAAATEERKKRDAVTRANRERFNELVRQNKDAAETLHRELLAEGMRDWVERARRGDLSRDS